MLLSSIKHSRFTTGKGDVDKLAKNVKAVANVGEFAGNRLYSAYAVDYAAKEVMEKVGRVFCDWACAHILCRQPLCYGEHGTSQL